MIKKVSVYLMGVFYTFAGLNHFVNPDFYIPLIPDYLAFKSGINYFSGLLEIIFGLGIFFNKTRKAAAWGIIVLLLLFIPSHIHFIKIGGCIDEGLCTPLWVAWLRMILIHPLLIFWAFFANTSAHPYLKRTGPGKVANP